MTESFIPAISVLVTALLLAAGLLKKLSAESIEKIIAGPNAIGLGAVMLFLVVCVLHLFSGGTQTWTADLLKVIVGVLTGVGASKIGKQDAVQMHQTAIGSQIKQVGRDLIEKMEGDISELRDSVVNQYNNIQQQISQVAHGTTPVRESTVRFRAVDEEPEFVELLNDIQRNKGIDWFESWIATCFENRMIQQIMRDKLDEIVTSGWTVKALHFDNIQGGLHVNAEVTRPFTLSPNTSFQGTQRDKAAPRP